MYTSDATFYRVPFSFLFSSYFLALTFNLLSINWSAGKIDMLGMVLLFWAMHQPQRVSIGSAFFLGLIMDVLNSHLLGQQALTYSCTTYFVGIIHKNDFWLNRFSRAVYIFLLLLLNKALPLLINLIMKKYNDNWLYISPLLSTLIEIALWPFISWLLFTPQRRLENCASLS